MCLVSARERTLQKHSQVINFFPVANRVDDNCVFIQRVDNPPVPDSDFVSSTQFPG